MMNILADGTLPNLEDFFGPPFQLSRYQTPSDLKEQLIGQDILLCRSTLRVNAALLGDSTLTCVATASSGTDHLDLTYLKAREITVCDAKGANAMAVTDYVTTCIARLEHQACDVGSLAGVIGVGAVGSLVVERLRAIGFEVLTYDPVRMLRDPDFISCEKEALFDCDLLCLHANLHDETPHASRHLLDAAFIKNIRPGAVIINAARGNIVDETALLAYGQNVIYCTDVYASEPNINPALVDYATLCTPHIAGHSIEARHRTLQILRQKLDTVMRKTDILLPTPYIPTTSVIPSLARDLLPSLLSLYDPYTETQALKQSHDLPTTFIHLRKAHCYRHDFAALS